MRWGKHARQSWSDSRVASRAALVCASASPVLVDAYAYNAACGLAAQSVATPSWTQLLCYSRDTRCVIPGIDVCVSLGMCAMHGAMSDDRGGRVWRCVCARSCVQPCRSDRGICIYMLYRMSFAAISDLRSAVIEYTNMFTKMCALSLRQWDRRTVGTGVSDSVFRSPHTTICGLSPATPQPRVR